MKTTAKKTFDAVKFMRDQREKLSEKLSKMTKALAVTADAPVARYKLWQVRE